MSDAAPTLSPRDEMIVTLSRDGFTAAEVAERAGITPRSVERIRAKHRDLLSVPREKPTARTVLESLLSSADQRIRLQAATALLRQDEPAPTASLSPQGAVFYVSGPPDEPTRDPDPSTDASRHTTEAAEAAPAVPPDDPGF